MADFESLVYEVKIEEHTNADALELAVIGDYRVIVRKGDYADGHLVAYIPEASIVPDDVIEELGLKGRLSGKLKNRVKAIKLRGELSQGLVYPVGGERLSDRRYEAGEDVTEQLGLQKWEPPIPANMRGKLVGRPVDAKTVIWSSIENIKKEPDEIQDGELVSITEKIHGTWCCFGYRPNEEEDEHVWVVTSKGFNGRGQFFKTDASNNDNLYVQTWKKYHKAIANWHGQKAMRKQWGIFEPVYLIGEIYGNGVQDLQYGMKPGKRAFALFDVWVGEPNSGRWLNPDQVYDLTKDWGIGTVPELYRGPFSKQVLDECTNGNTVLMDEKSAHIREGCVVRPLKTRRDKHGRRVLLKSVSEKYLLRRGGTEFN